MDTSPPHAANPSTSSVANKPERPTTLRLIGLTDRGGSDRNDAPLLSPPLSDDLANGRPVSAPDKYKYAVFPFSVFSTRGITSSSGGVVRRRVNVYKSNRTVEIAKRKSSDEYNCIVDIFIKKIKKSFRKHDVWQYKYITPR